jgi:hypothetical protein
MAIKIPAYTDFTTMFPELADKVDESKFNFWLSLSDEQFDQCRWDGLYFVGVLYWIAHSATAGTLTGSTGANAAFDTTIMKKVGDVQKQRSAELLKMVADDPYMSTLYGQQYLYYAGLVGMGGIAV